MRLTSHGGLKMPALKKILALMLILISLTSCSWIKSRRALIEQEDKQRAQNQPVPRAQYNDLLQKYEALNKKITNMQSAEKTEESALLNDLKSAKGEELAETVDVFGKQGLANKVQEKAPDVTPAPRSSAPVKYEELTDNDIRMLENEMLELRNAVTFMNQRKHNDSITVLKKLEGSKFNQISVRAKFLIGENLLMQNENDLALQAFEDIITNHAFSGVVLKTLGKLIAVTEKLKLEQKKNQYYSILHDFFGGV